MKRILTSFALVAASVAFSQVSISGETNDTPKATLDVKAINNGKANGILVPRVTKAEADGMPNPENASEIEESTLIYITGDVSGVANNYASNVDANGFYYFKDGKWVKVNSVESRNIKYKFNSVAALTPDSFDGYDGVIFTAGVGNLIPNPANYSGRSIILINKSGYNVTIPVEGGTQILPGAGIRNNQSIILASDGTTWYRVSS